MNKTKEFPYSRQYVDKKDINSVVGVLTSKYLTKGDKTIEFEKKCKNFVGAKYAAGIINASSALILCCKAFDLKKNDIVWTTANTYIASITCALHCGAKIDLVDINENDYNLDTNLLEKKLKVSKKKNKLPKVLIVVHLAGYSCDMEKIKSLSKKYKFKIIEDASHAFGAKYKNFKVGSCRYSDMTVFSFHPVKVITSAEGGMITTNNRKLYEKIISIRENGKIFSKKNFLSKIDPNFYDISDLGYNFRINEINSSLGISQIKKTNLFIKEKKIIADKYFKKLDKKLFILPKYLSNRSNSWHLFIIRLNPTLKNITKKKIINFLKKKKIFVNTHYIPLNCFNFLRSKLTNKTFKYAENYYKSAISIPIYPKMSKNDQNYVIKILNNLIKLRKF